MSNILKTPAISSRTKLLSFDLESNGLHGDVFAVGAVVMDATGHVHEEFSGRTNIVGKVDDWVEKNVLPVITDMEISHSSYKHLRENFWAWFVKAKETADYVLVNNGYPVEYRFLLACQDDDLDNRYWQHPFPILDLTSMLVQTGQDVQHVKNDIVRKFKDDLTGSAHHPLFDAKLAARSAFHVFTL